MSDLVALVSAAAKALAEDMEPAKKEAMSHARQGGVAMHLGLAIGQGAQSIEDVKCVLSNALSDFASNLARTGLIDLHVIPVTTDGTVPGTKAGDVLVSLTLRVTV